MNKFNPLRFIADNDGMNIVKAIEKAYHQGRADAYIECMRIVSECVWKDSEMLEKMIAEQLKEKPNEQ